MISNISASPEAFATKAVKTMRRTFKKTALTQTAEEYASRSSIHGIGYVFDRDLNIVDRLLWLLVVLALLLTAAIFTLNFWSQWRDEQVINYTKQIYLHFSTRPKTYIKINAKGSIQICQLFLLFYHNPNITTKRSDNLHSYFTFIIKSSLPLCYSKMEENSF